ncbi:MAG: 3'(2'),5'-bisphosphate nucleotidase [Desulfuromonas sp.]|nr:MAG: 3'(2'),5'-bisphosphate nucleotidase [Desulfuromonas sp.]
MEYRLNREQQALLCKLARQAGTAIMGIYNTVGDIAVDWKEDSSPLTEADRASHHCIAAGLSEHFPDIPVLSEEGGEISWEERSRWEMFFLVDPLDGTKEFINKNGEFTVNIALIIGSTPVFGVVFVPAQEQLYAGGPEYGSWLETAAQTVRKLEVPVGSEKECWNVVASRSHPSPDLARFLERLPSYNQLPFGSSLKFCRVADGSADYYPRFGPTMEWDTAAGHAVLIGAGGQVVDPGSVPLRYNKESLLNPIFLATGPPWKGEWA